MAPNFDFDLLNEIVNNAPSAGFGPRVNFGKLFIKTIDVVHWDNNAKKFVTRTWDGKALDQSKREYFQLTFTSDPSEFNSALTFEYKRRVDVKKSDRSSKDVSKHVLTDWTETVEPSLLKHLGKGWGKALNKGVYAEWQDVETVEKKDGKLKGYTPKDESGAAKTDEAGNEIWYVNTVPQIVRIFKSKAECEAARAERFKSNDEDAMAFGDDAVAIPPKVISDVQGILQALDGDQLIALLTENEPYKSYDLVALLTAAGADADTLALAAE